VSNQRSNTGRAAGSTAMLLLLGGCAIPARSTARVEDASALADRSEDVATDQPTDGAMDVTDAMDVMAVTDVIDVVTRDVPPDASTDAEVATDTPDSGPVARLSGRVRFLESGTVTLALNGVSRTFTADSGAPIDFDVTTPLPTTSHSITITGGTTMQTCTVLLPTPRPRVEPVVTGIEVRCVVAAHHQLTAATERFIDLPANAMPAPLPLPELPEFVVNQPTPVSVLLSFSASNVVFTSDNTLGAVEVAFIDTVTGQIAGRAVTRRANGNTRTATLGTVAIMQLAAGRHRIRPVLWHFDPVATTTPARIVYGPRAAQGITVASDGPLTSTFDAVLLDSLSTFERSSVAEWTPGASEPELTAGQQRDVPLAPATAPMLPAGGGALFAFSGASARGPVQWDLLADGATLARGMAFYDSAHLPHAMLAAMPAPMAIAPTITARVTRYSYRNSFGPANEPLRFEGARATHFSGMPNFLTPQTPARLSSAVFGPGVRMFAVRQSRPMWTTSTMPIAADPPGHDPIRLNLAAPRRVLVFARIASARVLSDGPIADVRLVRRTGATTAPLAQVSIQSSNAQNSQGLYLSAIADLPAGDHELQVTVRPVTSIGAIPPTGITTAYPLSYSPDLLDMSQPLGHIATGAIVLE